MAQATQLKFWTTISGSFDSRTAEKADEANPWRCYITFGELRRCNFVAYSLMVFQVGKSSALFVLEIIRRFRHSQSNVKYPTRREIRFPFAKSHKSTFRDLFCDKHPHPLPRNVRNGGSIRHLTTWDMPISQLYMSCWIALWPQSLKFAELIMILNELDKNWIQILAKMRIRNERQTADILWYRSQVCAKLCC